MGAFGGALPSAVAVVCVVVVLELWSSSSPGVAGTLWPTVDSDHGSPEERRQLLDSCSIWGTNNHFNLLSFGASAHATGDDTPAFESAWLKACSCAGGVLVVPGGHEFVVGPVLLEGPCRPNVALQVDGTIRAPTWLSTKSKWWIKFKNLDGLKIKGGGIFDGNGASWWSKSSKKEVSSTLSYKRKQSQSLNAVIIMKSTNVIVEGVTIQNAPQVHLMFHTCSQVLVSHVKITAPQDSPDTDGISFAHTRKITVQYSKVASGNQCVGVQSGSSRIALRHLECGSAGDGISIGSLGERGITGCIAEVRVRNVTVENGSGAVRIRTWQGGSGSVSQVSFQNIRVRNVSNPVVIDQYYCDSGRCRNQTTKAVAISDIRFRNIKGSYNPESRAVYIACSEKVPCTGLLKLFVTGDEPGMKWALNSKSIGCSWLHKEKLKMVWYDHMCQCWTSTQHSRHLNLIQERTIKWGRTSFTQHAVKKQQRQGTFYVGAQSKLILYIRLGMSWRGSGLWRQP